jgi:hypothetical protein
VAEGVSQVKAGDFEGAVLTLDRAVRRLTGQPGNERLLVQAYLHLGVALVALEQRENARARFKEALALDPALRLGADAFSPKVIAVFEEARREASASRAASGSKSGRKWLWVGLGAAAAGTATALALSGGEQVPPSFADARFGARTVLCPDGAVEQPVDVSVLADVGAGSSTLLVQAATVELVVTASPVVPSEVGVPSLRPTTGLTPSSVAEGSRVTVRVDTTLLCTNFTGGPSRFQEWTARLSLSTSEGLFRLETSDRLRVELP